MTDIHTGMAMQRILTERSYRPTNPLPVFRPGQSYCETCLQYKPNDGAKVNKGWKCNDCKGTGQ